MRIRNEHALALLKVDTGDISTSDSERRLIKLHSRHFLSFCRKASLFACVHRSRHYNYRRVYIGVGESPSAYRSKQSIPCRIVERSHAEMCKPIADRSVVRVRIDRGPNGK